MKKTAIILALLFLLSCLSGCGETLWNGHEKIQIPRELRFDCFYSKHFGTNTTATATSIEGTTGESQKINFYTTYRTSIDRFKKRPTWCTNLPDIDNNTPRYCYRVKILDIEYYSTTRSTMNPWKWPQTCYHIEVLKNESTGEEIGADACILFNEGSPQYVQYGYERLAVGEEYLIVDACTQFLTGWRDFESDYVYCPAYILEIQSIDGIEYLYACRDDITCLDFKIEITDPVENQVYKDYRDWDIIQYLEENNMENPTLDYKLRFDEFIEYRNEYNAEWNSEHSAELDSETVIKYASRQPNFVEEEDKIYLNKRKFD